MKKAAEKPRASSCPPQAHLQRISSRRGSPLENLPLKKGLAAKGLQVLFVEGTFVFCGRSRTGTFPSQHRLMLLCLPPQKGGEDPQG